MVQLPYTSSCQLRHQTQGVAGWRESFRNEGSMCSWVRGTAGPGGSPWDCGVGEAHMPELMRSGRTKHLRHWTRNLHASCSGHNNRTGTRRMDSLPHASCRRAELPVQPGANRIQSRCTHARNVSNHIHLLASVPSATRMLQTGTFATSEKRVGTRPRVTHWKQAILYATSAWP